MQKNCCTTHKGNERKCRQNLENMGRLRGTKSRQTKGKGSETDGGIVVSHGGEWARQLQGRSFSPGGKRFVRPNVTVFCAKPGQKGEKPGKSSE